MVVLRVVVNGFFFVVVVVVVVVLALLFFRWLLIMNISHVINCCHFTNSDLLHLYIPSGVINVKGTCYHPYYIGVHMHNLTHYQMTNFRLETERVCRRQYQI